MKINELIFLNIKYLRMWNIFIIEKLINQFYIKFINNLLTL